MNRARRGRHRSGAGRVCRALVARALRRPHRRAQNGGGRAGLWRRVTGGHGTGAVARHDGVQHQLRLISNITTLPPIITRREFGAASFGVVFGIAAMLSSILMALGPSLFGGLRQALGGYAPALLLGAALDVLAVIALIWGGRKALGVPH